MNPTPRIRRPPPSPARSLSGLLHRTRGKPCRAVRQAGLGQHTRDEDRAALALIERAWVDHPGIWWVSYSGGKESAIVLHLCHRMGWRGPAFFFWYEEMPDQNLRHVPAFCQRYDIDLRTLKTVGNWDTYDEVGYFFLRKSTAEEKRIAGKNGREWARAIRAYPAEQGWVGGMMGLRKDESTRRRMILSKKGPIYQTQDRDAWTCCPILNWHHQDVWAYIVENDLPYLPVYDAADNRETWRSEYIFSELPLFFEDDGLNKIRAADPEYYRRLVARFPEITALA